MTRTKTLLLATTTCAVLLAGCAAAPQKTPEPLKADPAAAVLTADEIQKCEQDGLLPTASIDPDGITTSPGSWPPGSTMGKIRSSGKLRVGVASDVRLWGARNPTSGDFEGFDIDLLTRIAKAIGPNVKLEYKVLNFSERLPALQDDQVDLVAHTMTMNCDRWFGSKAKPKEFINFSTEYYRAGQKVLVRTDSRASSIDDLKNESVCAATGSTSLANIQGGVVAKPVEVADVGECLVKFQEGEATAITGDDTVLAGFADQDPYTKVIGEPITQVPYGIGTAANDPGLTRFVNAVLAGLRSDGTLEAMTARYMAGTGELPPVPKAVYGRTADKLASRG